MKNKSKNSSAPKAGGYRFLAILFCLLAVGGLFLGLLSAVMKDKLNYLFSLGWLYEPGTIGKSDAVAALNGSLMGILIGIFNNLLAWFKAPNLANFNLLVDMSNGVAGARSWSDLIVSVALLALVLLLAITVVLSIILLVVSLVSGKAAKKCAMTSGVLTLLSYGGLALLGYLAAFTQADKFTAAVFDFPTLAVSAVVFLCLLFTALGRSKGAGFVNVLCFLFTLGAFVAVTYPGTHTATLIGADGGLVHLLFDAQNKFVSTYIFQVIALGGFLALVLFNLFCGVPRFNAKRGFLFDIVRYALQFIFAVLVMTSLLVPPVSSKAVFGADLIFTIVMLAAALLPLLFAIGLFIRAKKKKKAAKAVPEEEAEEPVFEYSDDDIVDEIIDDEIHRYIKERRPAPAPAPAPAPVPEPAPAPKEEPKPEPAPAPVYQPNIIVQAPPQPEQKPREKTEFERRMEAIAREEANNPPSPYEHRQKNAFTADAQPFQPVFTHFRKNNMQQMQIEDDHVSPYMAGHYDPFLSKLTSQEVSEFGDLFISNKFGMQRYLPVYVIGGDNEEFFNKVFIYLGRFRNYISAELLEKLNQYVSAVRAQK